MTLDHKDGRKRMQKADKGAEIGAIALYICKMFLIVLRFALLCPLRKETALWKKKSDSRCKRLNWALTAQMAYTEVGLTPRGVNVGGPESLLDEVKVTEMRQDLISGAGIKDMKRGPSFLGPRSVTVEE
jgi:hypothetical protein